MEIIPELKCVANNPPYRCVSKKIDVDRAFPVCDGGLVAI
jgi:hypothetical protein